MTTKRYRGSFADGNAQQRVELGTLLGDFAAGQESVPRVGTVQPRGGYASGVSKEPVDPTTPQGDFARSASGRQTADRHTSAEEIAQMDIENPRVSSFAEKVPTLYRLGDHGRTISSSDEDIRGRKVQDKDGQEIGRVEALLVDDIEGRVRFMEIASGGFLGIGETTYFIPVEAITRVTADQVQIAHTREHVAGAPTYDPSVVAKPYPYYGYSAAFGLYPRKGDDPNSVTSGTPRNSEPGR
jgi:hypothetical protein